MYYRVATQVEQVPHWQWRSTILSELSALFQWLRLYRAVPQDHLRVFSSCSREEMNEQAPVPLDIPLVFQTLQQSLNGSVLRLGGVRIELLAYLTSREAIVLPKQIHDRQLRIGQRGLSHFGNPQRTGRERPLGVSIRQIVVDMHGKSENPGDFCCRDGFALCSSNVHPRLAAASPCQQRDNGRTETPPRRRES